MKTVLAAVFLALAASATQAVPTKQHQKPNAETRRDAKQAQRRDTSRVPFILGIAH